MALMQEGKYAEALPLLKEAWQLSNQNSQIGLLLAETQIALHRSEDAEAVLKTVPLQDQDTRYQGLVAQIELLKQAAIPRNSAAAAAGCREPGRCRWQASWRCSCIRWGVTKRRWSCCSAICKRFRRRRRSGAQDVPGDPGRAGYRRCAGVEVSPSAVRAVVLIKNARWRFAYRAYKTMLPRFFNCVTTS
jgi:hypothetical protein